MSKFNLGNKFSYFSHSSLVTTGNTLPEKILVYCTDKLILMKIQRSQIIWMDFVHKESKQACKNSKEEKNQGLWIL